MAETLRDSWNKLLEYFKNMEQKKRLRFFILVALAIVIIVTASVLLTRKTYAVLYSGMNPEDAGEVLGQLNALGIDAKSQGTDTILVDANKANEARMQLAMDGYPKSGFGFDIFAEGEGLGSTDFSQRTYYYYQLQENIRQTINQIEKVEDSTVIITPASESAYVFAQDRQPAKATVLLRLYAGAEISSSEARAIYHIVSSAVSGLEISAVSITDTNATLYEYKEDDEEDGFVLIGAQLALQQEVQARLKAQIENILNPIFGKTGFAAVVNVELNFDTTAQQSVVFESPVEGSDRGLAVYMKELAEMVKGGTDGGVVGFDANGNASQYPEVAIDPDAVYTQISREANYEINETRTQIEKQKGSIQDLSVSVVIDSVAYDEQYLEPVRNLVKNAINAPDSHISVEMVPLKEVVETDEYAEIREREEEIRQAEASAKLWRTIIIAAAVLIAVGIIAFILYRMFVKKPNADYIDEDGFDIMLGDDEPMSVEDGIALLERDDSNLTLLENYIEKSPEQVAQLLRNWLSDENMR